MVEDVIGRIMCFNIQFLPNHVFLNSTYVQFFSDVGRIMCFNIQFLPNHVFLNSTYVHFFSDVTLF